LVTCHDKGTATDVISRLRCEAVYIKAIKQLVAVPCHDDLDTGRGILQNADCGMQKDVKG